jgi:hypothetical protein
MTFNAEQQAQEEIKQILKKINEAWVSGHPEKLQDYFHADMVVAQLGIGRVGIGRQACIQSYKDFVSRAIVREVKESDHSIDVWGDTAVASYTYEIDYEMNGKEHSDSGQDVFVFIRDKGKWLAVWRTLVPSMERKN